MGNISLEITAKLREKKINFPWHTNLPKLFCLFPPTIKALILNSYVVVQSANRVWLFITPWTATLQASSKSQNLPKFMSIASVMPSSHFIPCHPLLLLPSLFPSIKVFFNEFVLCIRWPKYWSFSISPSNEYSVLISFQIDWFDFLAVQGNLKSLLQHCVSKASILQCSALFMVKLWQPYITTGKTIALTILGVHWKDWCWSWNSKGFSKALSGLEKGVTWSDLF